MHFVFVFLLVELAMHPACCITWPHVLRCCGNWHYSYALTEAGVIQRKLWGTPDCGIYCMWNCVCWWLHGYIDVTCYTTFSLNLGNLFSVFFDTTSHFLNLKRKIAKLQKFEITRFLAACASSTLIYHILPYCTLKNAWVTKRCMLPHWYFHCS